MAVMKNTSGEGEFTVVFDALYYVIGKTKIKISEHFTKTDKTALDLLENTIKFEEHTGKRSLKKQHDR